MELKIKIDDIEIELQEYNVNELKRLIDQLSQHKKAETSLCPKLDEWLIQQKKVPLKTITNAILQLSRWCNTIGDPYEKYKPIAIQISILLFNKILPPLE